jgi:hypothetical protein
MAYVAGSRALDDVAKALEIDKPVRKITIEFPVDGAVVVTAEHYVEVDQMPPLLEIMRKVVSSERRD